MTNQLVENDAKQRQLALDAKQSFIVQAPAGSGKTELIIQRFLTLLIAVDAPEEVLAITFTKKAANEMRTRIIKALKVAYSEKEPTSEHAKLTWSLAKKVLERDKTFNWHLINNPNQLRIQTIDSLCTFLTKQLPLLSHFGSQPEIAENARPLYREAVQEVLMHVEKDYEWSEAIANLLIHLDNDLNKLHDLLVNLLSKRDQWLPYIHFNASDADIRKQLEYYLSHVISDSLNAVEDSFPENIIPDLVSCARYAADNLSRTNVYSEIIACRDLLTLPSPNASEIKKWMGLTSLLLTKEGTWRKAITVQIGFPAPSSSKNSQEKAVYAEYKEKLAQVIAQLQDYDNLQSLFADITLLPNPSYQDDQWDILKSLLYVLKIVSAQLRVTFQLHGQIDFIENSQAALVALGNEENPTDLALALDYQIKHILIDEFQDTSLSQYQLIVKLITGWEAHDGRTLFIVGDPMQSIYRFREADVGLFIRMRKDGIGNVKLTPLTLSVNFRSTSTIVNWNNLHFNTIFPSFNDMATGAVTYSPSQSHQHAEEHQLESKVAVKGFSETDKTIQANHIIDLIKETKNQFPNDKIAILVRSRSHLKSIIPALKKACISYRAVDIDPLASKQCIFDLLSLTCALLHPADRISWLAILRAPWCGLTLADLLIIAGESKDAAIPELLTRSTVIQRLSSDGQQRLSKTFSILKVKITERERYDLRYWVESTWHLLGGPAGLQDYADTDDTNAYFKLLEEIGQNNQGLNLDRLKEKLNRRYSSTHHDDETLQIMTIHTAKGLEFDTVILPHLESKTPNDDKPLLMWMDRALANNQTALLLAPICASGKDNDAIYEYISRQQKIKLDYEIDRLLYVAATRAKKRLFLYFNHKIDSGSFLKKLWPLFEKNAAHIVAPPSAVDLASEPATEQRYISRANSHWVNPITSDAYSYKMATHYNKSGFELIDHMPKNIGIVTHQVLQRISELSASWWTSQGIDSQLSYLTQRLVQLGMPPKDLDESAKLTQKAIMHTLTDARGQWIIAPHLDAKSEYAMTAIIDGTTQSVVIDRTFIDEEGARWIIDYKTAALSHRDLDYFLEKEQEKYLEKMNTYCEVFKMIDKRPIKMGLYFPALPAWKEWTSRT